MKSLIKYINEKLIISKNIVDDSSAILYKYKDQIDDLYKVPRLYNMLMLIETNADDNGVSRLLIKKAEDYNKITDQMWNDYKSVHFSMIDSKLSESGEDMRSFAAELENVPGWKTLIEINISHDDYKFMYMFKNEFGIIMVGRKKNRYLLVGMK